ncbi:hypothetical protein ANCCEY_05110 [Ancylostoma ceylanicum]|uniref:ZP domain-containing protein n=1 Tax=Ancylostoma ceylanicum TaxID=53326 RepID=A0A0D6M0F2_9BILA|nr:hypothetical protein ANCCEY_05110 [Ancylostoma ceylanicum]
MIVRALSIPVDNGVDGDPEIECGPTTIAINFSTRKQFEGHVYVKPRFITKVDRAFRISCFYMEASKDVGSQIDVSEMTTASVTHMVQMPVCRYDILEGGPNGIPVEFGKIGQQVYHRWSCASETGMKTVLDELVAILDSDGCAMDRYLLNNLEYPEDLLAGQEAHVYKYADRDSLYYQCQISIQVKENGVGSQGLPAHRIGDSAITKSTPLPFSLPVAGYIQAVNMTTPSPWTYEPKSQLWALSTRYTLQKSKQEFRDVCLSERLFVTSTCFVLGIFLCLIAVMPIEPLDVQKDILIDNIKINCNKREKTHKCETF